MEKEGHSQELSHGQEQQRLKKKKKTVSVPCRNFRRGHCRYGDLCIFQHAEAAAPTSASSAAGLAGKRSAKNDKERLRSSRHVPPPTLSSVCGHVSGSMSHGSVGASSSLLVHGGGDKDEVGQRMRNGGFTDEEVYELSLQGIKPSDPEAWDALAVLSGWDCDDDGGGDKDEVAQRMWNGGFTDEEVYELSLQGIKPSDPEAWDALAVLSGWDCDDDGADGDGDTEGRMMNLGFVGEVSDDDDDIYELSLQGIKSWDSEARVALDVLNGGGFFGPEVRHDS